ncbi:hypothetical protein Hypma_014955 [Hypsizygus marmoreus]|uniref:Uncharacterized protein n=1 Tax=Hypsizygus marmoreus TaxID=39966 RepID=A0A369K365_HYPMA|nr:hypothetical protein Hypma_014955 [Hypsizygus marmoreus]
MVQVPGSGASSGSILLLPFSSDFWSSRSLKDWLIDSMFALNMAWLRLRRSFSLTTSMQFLHQCPMCLKLDFISSSSSYRRS